jgi:hypothetical protein
MPDGERSRPAKPFHEWWVDRMGRGFDRWPEWLRIVLILWTLLAILFVFVDELHTNVPKSFGLLMIAPYALLMLVVVIPAMLGRWLQLLTWPLRYLIRLARRS